MVNSFDLKVKKFIYMTKVATASGHLALDYRGKSLTGSAQSSQGPSV